MNKRPTYSELIEKNLINNPDWLLFIEGNGPMPDQHPDVLRVIAPFFFYMGAFNHAREMSGKLSGYFEERASKAKLESYKVSELFESALHRSLAQWEDEARKLWHAAAEKRRQILDEILLKQRMAHLWVYEAYALTKLGRYDEISESAQKGFAGINKGKATHKAPHKNSRVYGLVDVLINLSIYKIEPNDENKKRAQKALSFYKKKTDDMEGLDTILFSIYNFLTPMYLSQYSQVKTPMKTNYGSCFICSKHNGQEAAPSRRIYLRR